MADSVEGESVDRIVVDVGMEAQIRALVQERLEAEAEDLDDDDMDYEPDDTETDDAEDEGEGASFLTFES